MRYRGQRHNIKVPVSGLKNAEQIRAAFERDYKRRYGHADAKAPAEFQALHLSAFAKLETTRRRALAARRRASAGHSRRARSISATPAAGSTRRFITATRLAPGFKAAGPAVIEEYGSTTIVWPGDRFEIGELHEIRIYCAGN